MKKLLLTIFTITIIGLSLSACDDLLTKAPLDSPSSATFYSNATELDMALNGIYRELWWQTRGLPFLFELDQTTDLGFLRDGDYKTIAQGEHDSDLWVFSVEMWEKLYSGVAYSNDLLENMDRARGQVSQQYFQEIEGQAKYLRAFFYHFLTELFGDVPFYIETPSIEDAQLPRTPKSEIVQQIYADLDDAIQYLPESWSSSDQGRITRGAALALKARVALYNEDYEMAAQAAQEVINSGVYELHQDYGELFDYAGHGSPEIIMAVEHMDGAITTWVPQRFGDRNVGSWATEVPSQFLVDTYQMTDGKHIDQSDLYDPANPFENRDPRLDATLLRPQGEFLGYIFETHPDSTETWRRDGDDWIRVGNQNVTNAFATFTGLHWRKYVSEVDFPNRRQSSELHQIYIRYAEVLLTYAEAMIESGNINQSVLDALNKVRARAYGTDLSDTENYPAITTTNQNELRRELRYERKVELAMEGFRLFDIRRWKIAEHVMNGPLVGRPLRDYSSITEVPTINRDLGHHPDYGGTIDLYRTPEQRRFNPNRDYLFPIPLREFAVNENLTQNPGY